MSPRGQRYRGIAGLVAILCGIAGVACATTARSTGNPTAVESSQPAVRVDLVSYLSLRERPWVVDRWGLTRNESLHVDSEPLSDGGLRITVESSHGFSGTRAVIDLKHGENDRLNASVAVKNWYDAGSEPGWSSPTGWIGVSSADWSSTTDPQAAPILLEIRLHDVPMHEDSCLHGVVEVPRPK